ncbi:hypothetical protein BUALT_Bualt16G0042900 [Buddleja alternifolia]|uniref:PGG domain-containing protein n=1 Tax=Buddleja alternifolia TaxID=168488 RepID=A0AAV6WFI8_9LAMI|nr:hypothetical protein BUALT_Bualt16G0042900 [Buddleja alternifolia]
MGSSYLNNPCMLMPSTVNVSNFVSVKPCLQDEDRITNFNIWKEQMLCLIDSQGLRGIIDDREIIQPAEKVLSADGDDEEKQLRRGDRVVKGWILGSIGNDALRCVWELGSAREVWLELEKIFNQNGNAIGASSEENLRLEHQYEKSSGNVNEEDGNIEAQLKSSPPASQDGASKDLSWYLPLYRAAQRSDWKSANKFFDENIEEAKAIVNANLETVLHVAVVTGKANDFVKKLLELLPDDTLTLKNGDGETALHSAAMVGNTEAAVMLVNRNSNLLYITNNRYRLPVQLAAIYGHKDTLVYLISMSKQNMEHSPFEGQLGVRLLTSVIASEMFDVAMELVEKYPDLARSRRADGLSALTTIAEMNSVFPSGENFSWWKNFIYSRIPVNLSTLKACKASSVVVAGDVESIICDEPSYKKSRSFQMILGGKFLVSQKLEAMLWKVVEHLVPRIKGLRDKKLMHKQALELLKNLCQTLESLPESEASIIYRHSIISAAKSGIHEVVEMIIDMFPAALNTVDHENGRNVFLIAARNRFENVFNLIYQMSDRKHQFCGIADYQMNNLMHLCAKLAPPDKLNIVPGAALQMQRELQWFKEMENFVRPSRRIWSNNGDDSPRMLFTKEHQELKAAGERWMKDTSNSCTIAAALIATVMFAAAFTVPGGIVTETGVPFFLDHLPFVLFAISDAVSLFTSITSLLMFLSILTSRYAEEDFLYVLPKRLSIGLLTLFISITFMLAAFSATLYLVFRGKGAWVLIPVAALACLPVASFVLLQFPLLVDLIYSTYGPGIFGKKSDFLLY